MSALQNPQENHVLFSSACLICRAALTTLPLVIIPTFIKDFIILRSREKRTTIKFKLEEGNGYLLPAFHQHRPREVGDTSSEAIICI